MPLWPRLSTATRNARSRSGSVRCGLRGVRPDVWPPWPSRPFEVGARVCCSCWAPWGRGRFLGMAVSFAGWRAHPACPSMIPPPGGRGSPQHVLMKRGISRLESPLPPREGGETLQRFLEARVGDRQGDTDVAFPCLAVAGTGGHDY